MHNSNGIQQLTKLSVTYEVHVNTTFRPDIALYKRSNAAPNGEYGPITYNVATHVYSCYKASYTLRRPTRDNFLLGRKFRACYVLDLSATLRGSHHELVARKRSGETVSTRWDGLARQTSSLQGVSCRCTVKLPNDATRQASANQMGTFTLSNEE